MSRENKEKEFLGLYKLIKEKDLLNIFEKVNELINKVHKSDSKKVSYFTSRIIIVANLERYSYRRSTRENKLS